MTNACSALSVRSNDLFILTASGTGGLEAADRQPPVSPGDPVLAVSIGSFGDRFAEIATSLRRDGHVATTSSGAEPPNPARSRAMLRAMAEDGTPARAILLTHNETSTGVVTRCRSLPPPPAKPRPRR